MGQTSADCLSERARELEKVFHPDVIREGIQHARDLVSEHGAHEDALREILNEELNVALFDPKDVAQAVIANWVLECLLREVNALRRNAT